LIQFALQTYRLRVLTKTAFCLGYMPPLFCNIMVVAMALTSIVTSHAYVPDSLTSLVHLYISKLFTPRFCIICVMQMNDVHTVCQGSANTEPWPGAGSWKNYSRSKPLEKWLEWLT